MSYIDVLREAEDMVTPGMSACQEKIQLLESRLDVWLVPVL